MKKLRIAVFVTSHFTVPGPKGIIYAPLDVASDLCSGLAKKGHIVDFYAPKAGLVVEVDGSQHFDEEQIKAWKNPP